MDTTTKTPADLESIARNPAAALPVRYEAARALLGLQVPGYIGEVTLSPVIVAGASLFFIWREGPREYRARSLCGRASASRNYARNTYSAVVPAPSGYYGGRTVGKRFKRLEAACEAAARALLAEACPAPVVTTQPEATP